MSDFIETFGRRVKQRRKGAGWSLRDLREKSGVAISQLSRVERGMGTSLAAALQIADGLGVSLAGLLEPVHCGTCGDCPPPGMTCNECQRNFPWWPDGASHG